MRISDWSSDVCSSDLLTDDIVLTSITALSRYNENYSVDRDGTPLKGAGVHADGRVKSFNQELRLSGDMGALNWLLGGNYARNKVRNANDILKNGRASGRERECQYV